MGPLFRTDDDKLLPRGAVQSMIERSAKALGLPDGDLGTHSLRFGGGVGDLGGLRRKRPS